MRIWGIRRAGLGPLAATVTRFFVCAALAAVSAPATAASITVINDDPAGVGFNDDTPRAAGGGNPGTTLGERRLFAFNFAADLIGDKVRSDVEIRVRASFGPLTCDSTSATLGQASPLTSVRNFGAGQSDTLYPVALANALAGTDLLPPGNPQGAPEADIGAQFNGNIDDNDNCLQGVDWYYGVDGNRPNGTVDFLGTVTHELIHGLGFLSFVNLSNGEFPVDTPGIFDRFIRDLDQGALWPDLTADQRAQSATNEDRVVWDGDAATDNGAPTLSGGTVGGQILLYTPSDLEQGSSVSHWDTSVTPNAIMEPSATGDIDVNDGIGLATCLLRDIGWLLTVGTACPDQSGAGSPQLTVDRGSIDFGAVTVGQAKVHTFRVGNDGSADLTIDNIAPPATPFSIQSQTCSEGMTLSPGAGCRLDMRFAPQQTGDFSDSIGIGSDGGTAMVALMGEGVPAPAPDISVTPATVAFSEQAAGSSSQRTVTVENQGNATLTIGSIGSLAEPFSLPAGADDCSGAGLGAGAQCTFVVLFEPQSNGDFSDALTVPSNDRNVSVSVSGSAAEAPEPDIDVNPAALDFARVAIGDDASAAITVRNVGASALSLGDVPDNEVPATPFAIASQDCANRQLAVGSACQIVIRFSPTGAGSFNDAVDIASDDPDNPNVLVQLTGEGEPDIDGDGVPGATEDNAPNGGDGNDDGIADSMQPDVVSLPGVRGGFVTLAASDGELVDVRALEAPDGLQLPENVTFDNGFFAFDVTGLSPGASVEVTLILAESAAPDGYYKFDQQTADGGMAVRFDFDAASGTGAQIEANRVVLNLVDGERGDSDLTANGRITDPGGPGFAEDADDAPAGSGQSGGDGGSGGGCALAADVRTPAPLLWLLAAWALIGLYRGGRRRSPLPANR